jgi:hypothetical protein
LALLQLQFDVKLRVLSDSFFSAAQKCSQFLMKQSLLPATVSVPFISTGVFELHSSPVTELRGLIYILSFFSI